MEVETAHRSKVPEARVTRYPSRTFPARLVRHSAGLFALQTIARQAAASFVKVRVQGVPSGRRTM